MFAVRRTLRTPDERFQDLPEFPYAPNYCEVSDGDGGALGSPGCRKARTLPTLC
jgi:hypothetical protein